MMSDSNNKIENTEKEQKDDTLKTIRNGLLFSLVAISAGVAIYYFIKEKKRKEAEKELLDYEIWG